MSRTGDFLIGKIEEMTVEVLDNITNYRYREEIKEICSYVIVMESANGYYCDLLIRLADPDPWEYLTACALSIMEYIDDVKTCCKPTGLTWPTGRPIYKKVEIGDEVKYIIKSMCRDFILDNTRE